MFIALLLPLLASAANLSLDDYLAQVGAQSPGLKAAQKSGEGLWYRKHEAYNLTSPYLFANYTNLDDKKENLYSFQGTRTQGAVYNFGLGANTAIGLNARYSYNLGKTDLTNATIATPNYYSAYNLVELDQALFRNGFGSEIRAQQDALNSSNQSQSYAQKFRALQLEVEAENTYWRLALARKSVAIEEELLVRAERLVQWAEKRVRLQLGDNGDRLQARATYDLRRLELQSTKEEERSAARAFNLLRNQQGEKVAETLALADAASLLKLKPEGQFGARLDVLAAEAQEKAEIASAQLTREKAKPTVNLFASLAWNGLSNKRSEAVNEAFRSKNSTTSFGVKLNVPLAAGLMIDTVKGTTLAKEAASLELEHKHMSAEVELRDLESRWIDVKSRLQLLQSIEAVQKEKYENERQRLLRGRTTTYQSIIFEQDYAQAQLLTIRTQAELLQLHSRFKLFRGEE